MDKPPRRFYEFDSFRVDAVERLLWQAGKPLPLTPKVFDILLVLLENKGQTVEKEVLIKRVWADTFVEEGSLNRNISTLRKALGDDLSGQRFIKTLPKRGYRFTANVEEIIGYENLTAENNAKTVLPVKAKLSLPVKSAFQNNRAKIIPLLIAILVFALVLAWTLNQPPKSKISLAGLAENERRQLTKRGSKNIEAYEDYVNGRTLWHQRSAEGLHQSIILLERAVKTDAGFALAHAALADAYAFDGEKRGLAQEKAEEASRLDRNFGEPYAAIGFVQMFWDWKLNEAKESFRKAIELSPDYATAHQWYAINLVATRFGGAALAEMKLAAELEPNSPAINADLCQMFYFLQKYDDAIAQCRKTLEMDTNFLNAHSYLYEIYTAKGMYAEAVAEFFKIEQLKSDFALPSNYLEKLKKAYAQDGIRAFWQTRIEFLEKNPNNYKSAQYYARLGEKEKALFHLRKSYESRDFEFVFFLSDSTFKDFNNEPQFIELAQLFERNKINL